MKETDTQGKVRGGSQGQEAGQWRTFAPSLGAPFLQHLHTSTNPEALRTLSFSFYTKGGFIAEGGAID